MSTSEEIRDTPNEMTDPAPATGGGSLADAILGANVLGALQQAKQPAVAAEPSVADLLLGSNADRQAASRTAHQQRVQELNDQRNAAYAASPLGQAGRQVWDDAVARGRADAEAAKQRREEQDAAVRAGYRGYQPGSDGQGVSMDDLINAGGGGGVGLDRARGRAAMSAVYEDARHREAEEAEQAARAAAEQLAAEQAAQVAAEQPVEEAPQPLTVPTGFETDIAGIISRAVAAGVTAALDSPAAPVAAGDDNPTTDE